jgi:hypothetical protein
MAADNEMEYWCAGVHTLTERGVAETLDRAEDCPYSSQISTMIGSGQKITT